MAYESVRLAIGQYIDAHWATLPTWGIVAENLPDPTDRAAGKAWVRVSIRPVKEQMGDIGARMKRTNGLIWFQIFVPQGAGSKDATGIGDKIDALFFQTYITDGSGNVIRCQDATLSYVGSDPTGWQMWRCVVTYVVDVFT